MQLTVNGSKSYSFERATCSSEQAIMVKCFSDSGLFLEEK